MPDFLVSCAKPFVKWAGGKSQLIPQIVNFLPRNFASWKDATYVEPFVGGGAMLFYMLKTFPNIKCAVINDVNPELITCYQTVKNECGELIKSLAKIEAKYKSLNEVAQKDFFLEKRAEFNTGRGKLSNIETSTLFLFINKTCFNGLYRVNKNGDFNVPFGRAKSPTLCDQHALQADSKLLEKVEILNGDFTGTLQANGAHTLYYFDPPYRPLNATSNFNDYAKDPFNDDEQVRLKKFCDKIDKKKQTFILSNSDCAQTGDPFFDELYSSYTIERVAAARFINANGAGRGKINEILIHNK